MADQNKSLSVIDNKKQIVSIVQQDSFKKQLAAALMNRLPEDYVVRSAIATINGSSLIQECTPLSTAASILLLAQAGLAPEPWKGHGYLVPRNIKVSKKGDPDRWEKHCTALIGYRGYINLAYKSPQVLKVGANPVYEGDIFDLDQVLGTVTHKPWIRPEGERKERGKLIGAYAFVKMKNGETLTEWMLKEDIDAVRSRSAAGDFGPWKTDYSEMARKTPLRRLFKWVPDPDLQRIAALEEANDFGNVAITIDGNTGEIVTSIVETQEPEKAQIQMPQRQIQEPKTITGSNTVTITSANTTTVTRAAEDNRAEPETVIEGEVVEEEPALSDSPIADIFEAKPEPAKEEAPKTAAKEKRVGIGPGQSKRMHAIANAKKTRSEADFDELKAAFKIDSLSDFPVERIVELEQWVNGKEFGER